MDYNLGCLTVFMSLFSFHLMSLVSKHYKRKWRKESIPSSETLTSLTMPPSMSQGWRSRYSQYGWIRTTFCAPLFCAVTSMHHVAVLLDMTIKLEDIFDPPDEPYHTWNIYSFLTDRFGKLLLLIGVVRIHGSQHGRGFTTRLVSMLCVYCHT